ncbi:putative invertase inhibitor, partial [Bienertia sinuspersici]
ALGSDPRSVNATTVTQLGAISFQMGISKTISILSKIDNIFKDPKFDPNARDALKACYDVYLDAKHGLQEGLMSFKNGDYSAANYRANGALIVPTTCENGFEVSPFTKENSDFFQLAAISLGSTTITKATNLVPDTCMEISNSDPYVKYDFCVKAFGSNPRSSKANLDELAEISFNITTYKARSVSSTIDRLMKDPKSGRLVKQVLKTCSDLYSGAPEDLKVGLEALKSGKFFIANVRVTAAMGCGSECEDAFKEMKVKVSPLTKENSDYFELGAITLAFTNLLQR